MFYFIHYQQEIHFFTLWQTSLRNSSLFNFSLAWIFSIASFCSTIANEHLIQKLTNGINYKFFFGEILRKRVNYIPKWQLRFTGFYTSYKPFKFFFKTLSALEVGGTSILFKIDPSKSILSSYDILKLNSCHCFHINFVLLHVR